MNASHPSEHGSSFVGGVEFGGTLSCLDAARPNY